MRSSAFSRLFREAQWSSTVQELEHVCRGSPRQLHKRLLLRQAVASLERCPVWKRDNDHALRLPNCIVPFKHRVRTGLRDVTTAVLRYQGTDLDPIFLELSRVCDRVFGNQMGFSPVIRRVQSDIWLSLTLHVYVAIIRSASSPPGELIPGASIWRYPGISSFAENADLGAPRGWQIATLQTQDWCIRWPPGSAMNAPG